MHVSTCLFMDEDIKMCCVYYYKTAWNNGLTYSYREWWF